jgi:hypothetical protein
MKREKKEKAAGRLGFELDSVIDESLVTAHAGVPLALELFRTLGLAEVVEEAVGSKRRDRGLKAWEMVESFFALWLAGGDRCEDFKMLREDAALAELLGHGFPAPNTARDFLDGFDDAELPLWRAGDRASIREESSGLAGLGSVNRALLGHLQRVHPVASATLDIDATIIESHKRSSQRTYDGCRGYQPVVGLWAEQDVVVLDEFRDGNVPAGCGNLRFLERALAQLPSGIERIYLRADSALYEGELLRYCEDHGIGYAISADMSRQLEAVIAGLPEEAWSLWSEESDAVREWAEVSYVPSDGDWKKWRGGDRRYLAIRVVRRQRDFVEGDVVRHFAVVTNRAGDGLELLRWHREKAGTVEHAHDVLKNELSGSCLPSDRFGANAAWFRLNVLLYNLLSFFKRAALPGEFLQVRPKRLRFVVFNVVGKVVRHARETLLRLADQARLEIFALVRGRVRAAASS